MANNLLCKKCSRKLEFNENELEKVGSPVSNTILHVLSSQN